MVAALLVGHRDATRNRRRFLVALALLLVFAVGEELSWGQNLFGWRAPDALAPESGGLIQAGHGDLTLHNLSFRSRYLKFSIGGFLFSFVLLAALFIHGIWLPRASRRDDPRASWLVDRVGIFVPTIGLGALMFAAALAFHLAKPIRGTETREYKELIIAVIFAFMLVHAYFSDGGRPRIGATLFLLGSIGAWGTGVLLLLPR